VATGAACVALLALWRAPAALRDLDTAATPPADWRFPRLGFPAPPPFEASADPDQLRIRWNGEDAVVRTTVVGGPARRARTLLVHPSHAEVHDELTNDGDGVVGLRIRHAVATAEPWVRVGGRADAEGRDAYAPWNPTVFTPHGRGSLGLVVEDDVFRQQLHVDRASGSRGGIDAAAGTIGMRTDMLCLGPHEHATLVWSVYPTASRRYFDFINTLRADWNANRTIPGAMIWFKPDDVLALPPDALKAALDRSRVAVASMSGGWIDPRDATRPRHLGFGTDVGGARFASLRERLREAIGRLRAARPALRVLVYFDAQRDSDPDAPGRFADSLLLDPTGRPERNVWGGLYSPAWSMVPTLDNAFGRAIVETAAAMRKTGADGLYWDEMEGVDYGGPHVTSRPWDGRSCLLAADGSVRARVGLTDLLSAPLLARIARGAGPMLANGPPTLGATQARPDLRMVEAQHNDVWGAYAQLTTPIGYIGGGRDVATLAAKIDEGLLLAGLALGEHADLLARLFPFTPEYVQQGTLRGRERIVTTESGTHGWLDGGETAGAWRYGRDGVLVPAPWHVKRRHGALLVRVRLGQGEIGVIERSPAPQPGAGESGADGATR